MNSPAECLAVRGSMWKRLTILLLAVAFLGHWAVHCDQHFEDSSPEPCQVCLLEVLATASLSSSTLETWMGADSIEVQARPEQVYTPRRARSPPHLS